MKKIVSAVAILVASTAATAGPVAFITHDYDRTVGPAVIDSQHEITAGARLGTKFGTVDGALLVHQFVAGERDNGLGFAAGYSNGTKMGPVTLTGRIGYGRINQVDVRDRSVKGNSEFLDLSAEAGMKVLANASGFASFRHRTGINGSTATSNRYAFGLETPLGSGYTFRIARTHVRQDGVILNGFSGGLSKSF